jgi:hypothetical protein
LGYAQRVVKPHITPLTIPNSTEQIAPAPRWIDSHSIYVNLRANLLNPAPVNSLPPIPFPDWFEIAAMVVMCTAGAVFLWLVVASCRRSRRLVPPIVLLPAAAQFIWFVPGAHTATFYAFVPLFHCLQYLYIAWAMQMGLRLGRDDRERSWRSIRTETLRWGLRNCGGGAALFIALPWLFSWIALPAAAVTGIVLAGVNIHHFFVDGVIWKLRNVSAQSPLMMRIPDLAFAPVPARA